MFIHFPVPKTITGFLKFSLIPQIDSHSHRMFKAGRDLWSSSDPTLLFSSRLLMKMSKKGKSTTTLGNLCQHSVTLIQNVSQCSDGNSCILVRVHYLLSCPWATLRRVCSIFFTLSIRYSFRVISFPLSLLFPRKNSLSSLSLLCMSDLSSLLLFLLHYIPVSLVLGSPALMSVF